MIDRTDIEREFWRVFGRVLGRNIAPGHYLRGELPEWDSLRHVELMFELEEKLRVEIPTEVIAELFSSTDTILSFLVSKLSKVQ